MGARAIPKKLFRILSSLPLAVVTMSGIIVALATATILESLHGTLYAQYYVYDTRAFDILLGLLGLNILCVALSRLPWQRRHLPFLLAHAGILLVLGGSAGTRAYGLNGVFEVREGERNARITNGEIAIVAADDRGSEAVPLERIPLAAKFRPIPLPFSGEEWAVTSLYANSLMAKNVELPARRPANETSRPNSWGVQVRLRSQRAKVNQEFWLFGGDPAWSVWSQGPVTARLLHSSEKFSAPIPLRSDAELSGFLEISAEKDGLQMQTYSTRTGAKRVRFSDEEIRSGKAAFSPGWMDFEISVLAASPNASLVRTALPSTAEKDPAAVEVRGPGGLSRWIRLGENLTWQGKTVGLHPRTLELPFSIELLDFSVRYEHGAPAPSAYTSVVRVHERGRGPALHAISMNEPLEVGPYTFYQSGYRDIASERPVSVLSVNRDPGRKVTYFGCFLIVFGSVLLTVRRYRSQS